MEMPKQKIVRGLQRVMGSCVRGGWIDEFKNAKYDWS
jgi:hypothetical protein